MTQHVHPTAARTGQRGAYRVASRGGAIAAGALAVTVLGLAGGSFALAGGSDSTGSPAELVSTTGGTSTLGAATFDRSLSPTPSAGTSSGTSSGPVLALPHPVPAPVAKPVQRVLAGAVGAAKDLTTPSTTPPSGDPDPSPPGAPSGSPGGADRPPAAGSHLAPQHTTRSAHASTGAPAGLRDPAGRGAPAGFAGATGHFADQQTRTTVTPRLSPRALDGLPVPDLGGRGVPGALIVIATVGVAALGASHLGVWYNRRPISAA